MHIVARNFVAFLLVVVTGSVSGILGLTVGSYGVTLLMRWQLVKSDTDGDLSYIQVGDTPVESFCLKLGELDTYFAVLGADSAVPVTIDREVVEDADHFHTIVGMNDSQYLHINERRGILRFDNGGFPSNTSGLDFTLCGVSGDEQSIYNYRDSNDDGVIDVAVHMQTGVEYKLLPDTQSQNATPEFWAEPPD